MKIEKYLGVTVNRFKNIMIILILSFLTVFFNKEYKSYEDRIASRGYIEQEFILLENLNNSKLFEDNKCYEENKIMYIQSGAMNKTFYQYNNGVIIC